MNALVQLKPLDRHDVYQWFSHHRRDTASDGNAEWLCRMLASWSCGEGALPDHLGLEPDAFDALVKHHLPGIRLCGLAESGRKADFSRMLEREDLLKFLLDNATDTSPTTVWIAEILVAGCLGDDHLWQDLGLWTRADLSALIALNFPAVAAGNTRDMKWKKYLYKQLCEAEGIYVCRAPSCEVCSDYARCFGPED